MPINVQSWSIDRGRSYELDKNSPGTARINMIDTTGELDPTSPAYAFDPMTPAAISLRNPVTSTDHTVFRGHVARLTYDVHKSQDYAYATLELVDGMDLLAATEMVPGIGFGFISSVNPGNVVFIVDSTGQAAGNRINSILNSAGQSPGLREVFSGNIKLKATNYAPRSSALSGILDVADAEFPGVSNFYFQKDGRATFHGRLARFNPADAQYHISTWRCGDMAAVTADSTRARITELSYDGGDKDKIINSVLSTSQGFVDADYTAQLVENAASIATYGRRSISFENLLTDGDFLVGGATAGAAVKKFGTYYVNNYKDPRIRVNRISFKTLDPGDSNATRVWAILCGVDISDIIRLTVTHPQGGFTNEDFYVEGLHYETVPSGKSTYDWVTLTLDVSPRSYYNSNPG